MSGARYDCVVVGGGHNGLVCAAYLARGGRSVLVLEAADEVGGAAVTREFAPGFRVSACAHLLHSMSGAMIHDLRLEDHGLTFSAREMPTVALAADGGSVALGATSLTANANPLSSGVTVDDAAAYPGYVALLNRLAQALRPVLDSVPPRLGTDAWADKRALLQLGWQIRRLGRHDMRELLRIGGMNVFDLLKDNFESPLLQGALAFDAILGSNFGPRSPGSVFTLLYRLAGATAAQGKEVSGTPLSQPTGGLGALSRALSAAAVAAGAEVRTNAAVERIIVRDHRASGVQLASGETITANTVISNVDPQATFLRLLGAEYLDAGFTRRVSHLRTRGLAAKLHLALDDLPRFSGVSEASLGGRLLIAPSLEYLERAFNHSKYGEFSNAPAIEITVPTVNDRTLAPAGKHVLSAVVQYAPYALKAGWDAGREQFANIVVDTIERYSPGLGKSIISAQLLTPSDIEREFRITGGHWHHAELALDQFFMMRPVPGAAQYQTPVDGLYLCGAGCHPGGGVMGTAGRNAARQVLGQAA
ncbi:MAG TPA: NAD(P)/FAD-dependent oxidoreductase [Steroidobacteraceae bacterium]|nr:NAD(P)/FAD-dependent oxidoreductase [Steroidobacteraceae bacterium]